MCLRVLERPRELVYHSLFYLKFCFLFSLSHLSFLSTPSSQVEAIVEEVNEEKRKFEKKQRKLEILEKLPQLAASAPSLSDPSCTLEMEGVLLKVSYLSLSLSLSLVLARSFPPLPNSPSTLTFTLSFPFSPSLQVELGADSSGGQNVKSTSERAVFLFTDMLVWAKEKEKGVLRLDGSVGVDRVRVVDVSGYQEILQNSFEVHDNAQGVCVAVLSAKTFSAKREWVQLIKKMNRDFLMRKMNAG